MWLAYKQVSEKGVLMSDISRRSFLTLAGGTIATGILGACSRDKQVAQAAQEDTPKIETPEELPVPMEEPDPEPEPEPESLALEEDSSGFVLLADVVPDAIQEIRYYTTFNFVGDRIDGYEQPVALITREAAEGLRVTSDILLEKGYRLKIFDAYRPQMAVDHFVRWSEDLEDTRMQQYFYPELDKSVLFDLGYIDRRSGHTRGSTVDLTLFDMNTEREVDMGGTFDYFGELSHPDYTGITVDQYANRMILREAMIAGGFTPLPTEWWHFRLDPEPYPDTYFTFPVSIDSVRTS